MRNRPLSVTLISAAFGMLGAASAGGVMWAAIHRASRIDSELVLLAVTAAIAAVGGVLMFRGVRLGCWILGAWMLARIVLSSMHSTTMETLILVAVFSLIAVLLARPSVRAYFRDRLAAH